MQIAAAYDPVQAFMASRDAAVRRLSAGDAPNGIRPNAGKSLTRTPAAVETLVAARSASGPVLGRHVDLVA